MAFDKVDQAVPNFSELEQRILKLWKERDVFHRSLKATEGGPEFIFYEGPPTANGLPHNGHVLTRAIKDLFPRYQTMRGYHVERRAGWDTHGLPVEVEVEKSLGISGKEAIVAFGVDAFAKRCLQSVFQYTEEWEDMTERIGFWVDLDKAYVTYHKSYVESVWWALSELFKRGLLYQGHKVVWWWAQGGTALSAGEVGNAYKTVQDPSVYVRFPLLDEEASLVIWTTTPWTLSSNMFVGAHADFDYAYVLHPETGEVLVLAEALVADLGQRLGVSFEVQKVVKGRELFQKRYKPPFDTFSRDIDPNDERYWRVIPGDVSTSGSPQWFVTLEAGTGLVHLAPAFGEDDWKVWRNEKQANEAIEMLCAVEPSGGFGPRMADLGLEGVWVKDGDKAIVRILKERELLLHHEAYEHEYPFCWRSDDDPLIQYARQAWFIRTTEKIDEVIANNQEVNWQPAHIKDGRFGDFLNGNVDWALSRERFWGTPLNIWSCDGCDHQEAPASVAEIEAKNPDAFKHFYEAKAADPELSEHLIVHKPWIDEVTYACPHCSGTMRRVPEVIDCWFDSGCMPFAQLGYPHLPGSQEAFERAFPADFISEAIDQTRGWFYSLMMVSNLVFADRERPHPYKRCIVLGHVLDKQGKKESKSKGNYTPPEVILERVRMEFAPLSPDADLAKKAKRPKAGSALIGRDDLEGLDLKEGDTVRLYRKGDEAACLRVKLRVQKELPRRVILLAEADQAELSLAFAPERVRPIEVPSLPADQRVMVEAEGVPAPGADAFRWFFYASNPPWNSTRHALSNVRGQQKELPIKLRNVYAFFITYANIDAFDPVKDEPMKRAVKDRALLDRWVLSELEKTKLGVQADMDAFLSYEAATKLNLFVEGLSNWYVRRSRARFWAEGRGEDKLDAYWTLFECLRELSLMLAPFLPFASEDMYQNLVVRQYGEALADSVHLRAYPIGDAHRIDEALLEDMAEVRELVSLGLQVRASHKLKTRQPLASAELILAKPARQAALAHYEDIMKEELNVQAIQFSEVAEKYVSYTVKPNFKTLGARLGPKMKASAKVIAATDPLQLKHALDEHGQVELWVDGEELRLSADDLVVRVEAKPGFAAADGPVGVMVLNTQLSDALIREGRFRELLSRIQAHRKALKLDFEQRIQLALAGDPALLAIANDRAEEIKHETLSTQLLLSDAALDGDKAQVKVDGLPLEIAITL